MIEKGEFVRVENEMISLEFENFPHISSVIDLYKYNEYVLN